MLLRLPQLPYFVGGTQTALSVGISICGRTRLGNRSILRDEKEEEGGQVDNQLPPVTANLVDKSFDWIHRMG